MNSFLRWSSLICYVAALTILLVMQRPPGPPSLFPVAHCLAMGLLSVLILRALTDPGADGISMLAFAAACLIALTYAVGMEFVQPYFGRTCSRWDMLAGGLGIVVLTPVYGMLRSRSVFLR